MTDITFWCGFWCGFTAGCVLMVGACLVLVFAHIT